MRLDDTLEGFWLARKRNLSEHTFLDYQRTFNRLREFLGNVVFEKITTQEIEKFLNFVSEKYELSDKTLLNHWVALSALWTWAEVNLDCKHVIRHRIERPKPQRRQSDPYTEAEVKALLDSCDHMNAWNTKLGKHVIAKRPTAVRDRAIILVLLDTGIRAEELCNLRIKDYDKKRGQLTVQHGKGDKKRVLYLGTGAQQGLWRYLNTRIHPKGEEPLFATRTGTPLTRTPLLHMIERLGEHAGIPDAGLHRFRHTFAINYLRNGGNLLSLQAMLGHEKLDTVRIYARLAEVDLEKTQKAASPVDNWRL